jgi:hypothetical protein
MAHTEKGVRQCGPLNYTGCISPFTTTLYTTTEFHFASYWSYLYSNEACSKFYLFM